MRPPINLMVPSGGPSPQSEFDIFDGHWAYHIPVENTRTGSRPTFFHQPNLIKLIKTFYPAHAEYDVLELGPHEGEHSFHLHHLPVRHVYSIEGRPTNFLKCLIVKNQLFLDRVRFSVGNFVEYLKFGKKKWDIIYCSGVLYHMSDPVEVINFISKRTKILALSTHVYHEEQMRSADERTAQDRYPTGWLNSIDQDGIEVERLGLNLIYYPRRFSETAEQQISGQGASHSMFANFMLYEDIVRVVATLGGSIVHAEDTGNGRGPHVDMIIEFPD